MKRSMKKQQHIEHMRMIQAKRLSENAIKSKSSRKFEPEFSVWKNMQKGLNDPNYAFKQLLSKKFD